MLVRLDYVDEALDLALSVQRDVLSFTTGIGDVYRLMSAGEGRRTFWTESIPRLSTSTRSNAPLRLEIPVTLAALEAATVEGDALRQGATE